MRTSVFAAISLAAVAAFSSTPAQAADTLTLVGTFSGNQCTGSGGFPTCVASGTTTGSGALTHDGNGSPSIIRLDSEGSFNVNSIFPSINGSELTWSLDGTMLTYTYTPTGDDPIAHYLGLYQGGAGTDADGNVNNPYLLFYSADGISTGTINLATYYQNSGGFSHIDLFDTGAGGGVPEPATWAMMLLGIGMIGSGARRRRQKQARSLVLS